MRMMPTAIAILALALAAPATARAENIRDFSFSTYIDGPDLVAADLSGRLVGILAACDA